MRTGSVLTLALLLTACHHEDGGAGDGGVDDLGEVPSLDAACALGGAKANLKRLDLVVVYDRSGSMGDGMPGNDPALKWIPVGAGMKAFFTDPASTGVSASLSYFPYKANPNEQCNASAYFFPDVPLTALPSTVFGTDIDATTCSGQTPTQPAIDGAIALAQSIGMMDGNAKLAIVLVTDGEPDICSSSVHTVAQAVGKVKAEIPTYVIGIGLSQAALEEISMAGGTGEPILASVGDAAQTSADIQAALASIRGQQVPCDFPLPSPPAGQVLDVNKVNVLYTPGGGMQTALSYTSGCTGGEGWRYDDLSMPTKVELCPTTCATIQADKGAAIDILFGCQTRGDVL